jgi:hypothetical protein
MYALAGYVGEMIRPVSELWHQLRVLTRRYAHLLWNDPRSLRLLFLQAPVVALFLLVGFVHTPYEDKIASTRRLTEEERQVLEQVRDMHAKHLGQMRLTPEQRRALQGIRLLRTKDGKGAVSLADVLTYAEAENSREFLDLLLENKEPVVPDRVIVNPAYTYLLLCIVTIAVLWFGCNNAAKEIVKEEAVYGRERAVNLKIGPYLLSKFLVQALICAVQTFLFMLVLYGVLEAMHYFNPKEQVPPDLYLLDYASQYGVLLLLSLAGVAMGLLLSACVSSPDRASALLPYVLIPQMILGGGLIAIHEGAIYWLAVTLSPVYWAFRAVRLGETSLPPDSYYHMNYDDSVWVCCLALLIQTFVLLLLTGWFLKRKDSQ